MMSSDGSGGKVECAVLLKKIKRGPIEKDQMTTIGNSWSAIQTYKINDVIPVTLYKSNRSRLRVVIAETPGPLVKGLISFVTETLDNDGLPHTLEHLTFMGSESYPYKGILDLIANQCMASGTNARTCQDHTAYELTTIGSKGFLMVLPIYLDHLLHPTLTDAQFLTEVHHINEKGEDAGVVYSEMQELESEMSNIVHWKRKELFYPEYNPYRVETGGRLAALRTTCNMNKIRNFHRDFYHISNMLVTVCGFIDRDELFNILSAIEDTSKQQVPHLFNSPFKNEMLPFAKPVDERIVCPSEDEKLGMVEIAWNGPQKDLETLRQLEVLGHYLCDTAASPIEQDFVQQKEQLASSVWFYVREQCLSEIVLVFNGVPVNQLNKIKKRLFEKTLSETFAKNFEMERMKNTITQLIDRKLSQMETDCHDYISEIFCMYQIYGTEEDLEKRLNHVASLRKMLELSSDHWSWLAGQYLTEKCICVMGYPSRDEVTRITALENDRIKEQRKKLGKSGLHECSLQIQNAIQETKKGKPSPALLKELTVQELENFTTFNIKTLHAVTAQNDGETFKLPLPVFIHSTETHFVEFLLVWDTKLIPLDLRMWLMLYFEVLFQSPAIVDGQKKSYEEVVKLCTRDLVSYYGSLGVVNRFWSYCSISLKASPERYVTMLAWLKTFVLGVIFEVERVKVAAQRLVAAADEEKRDGCEMRNALLFTTVHDASSNEYMYGLVQLEKFHEHVLNLTDNSPACVLRKLEELREALINAPVNVHIVCNTEKIMPFLPRDCEWLYQNRKYDPEASTGFRDSPGNSLVSTGFGRQRVIAVAACESSFLKQSVQFKYPLGSEEMLCVDLIAQYMSQTEGPLYKELRGNGLAYGVRIVVNSDSQLLNFSIYRSAQLEEAYERAREVVLKELERFDKNEFEAAKRSLVSEIVQCEDTVINAAHRVVHNQFRGLSSQFWREYCERIWKAPMTKVLECGSGFVRDLFDDQKCSRAVAVPHGKLKDIEKYFKGIEVVQSSDLHVKFN